MKQDARSRRRTEIEDVAFDLIEANGFAGTSMLAVAKAAKASNETLYNWYGDKAGLFSALVARNAATVKEALEAEVSAGAPPLDTLRRIGPRLLAMLLSPRAIALNRAAAADETGTLGRALNEAGRQSVGPALAGVIAHAIKAGDLSGSPRDVTELFFTLLIGDLQIRRITGAIPDPTAAERSARAETAVTRLLTLAAPG